MVSFEIFYVGFLAKEELNGDKLDELINGSPSGGRPTGRNPIGGNPIGGKPRDGKPRDGNPICENAGFKGTFFEKLN